MRGDGNGTGLERKRTVLVVGAAQPAAHAVVRSLSRAGYRVIATRGRAVLAGRTTYADSTHTIRPARELDGFLADIDAVCARESVEVIVPLADETLGALLRGRRRGDRGVVMGPGLDVWERLSDKRGLAEAAEQAGLGSAKHVVAGPEQPLAELPPLPAYVKVVSGMTEGLPAGRPLRVTTPAACREAVGRILGTGRTVIVQEEVVGERWRFHFARRGALMVHVAAQTLAEYPGQTGQSTVSRFVPTPPVVAEAAGALLEAVGYEGVGSLQMIVNERGVYPHDANLRIPASVGGTIAAGLDLPRLGVEIALGEASELGGVSQRSFRFVQLHGELAALNSAVRGREVGRSAREIAKEVLLGVVSPRRIAEPWDARDPLPTLAAISDAFSTRRA